MTERSSYFCDHAWLGGERTDADVLVAVEGGTIAAVERGARRPPGAVHLAGLTLPGFASAHSHAFHRALRGRTQHERGTFFTWREQMYGVAESLTPSSLYELARATYAEMALAGITSVGEFHYVHHDRDGRHYSDPNEMGRCLLAAAAAAGLRVTLLDACYLESSPGRGPEGAQRRFADASAEDWAERVGLLASSDLGPGARLGAAIHSVRAVPPSAARVVAAHAATHSMPLHFHLSEQVAENEASSSAYGVTPTELLERAGALGPLSTAVHATHLADGDVATLGRSRTGVCMCPTTEQDLADGIGPAGRLATAGVAISLGSDGQSVIDPFQEMRSLELDERLATGRRGHFLARELLGAATARGNEAIGWPEAGRIAVGAVADLVTVSLDSPRLAGWEARTLAEHAVFVAGASDVAHVVSSGRVVVADGRHLLVDDVPAALRGAVAAVLGS